MGDKTRPEQNLLPSPPLEKKPQAIEFAFTAPEYGPE